MPVDDPGCALAFLTDRDGERAALNGFQHARRSWPPSEFELHLRREGQDDRIGEEHRPAPEELRDRLHVRPNFASLEAFEGVCLVAADPGDVGHPSDVRTAQEEGIHVYAPALPRAERASDQTLFRPAHSNTP